ncbi:MAG: radical SAM protein [Candidatus Aminicenantes bacterium]|jgi:radical SAM superfamily enzyme YgiQ (UPF0313 family)
MDKIMEEGFKENGQAKERILLALLPFWDPQIPPLGIAVLKSVLQKHHFFVKTVDLNIEVEFREIYGNYFDALIDYVPGNKRNHLYNIGHEVLKNHMMAHLNYTSAKKYRELIKILVSKTFFCKINDSQALELQKIIDKFYIKLREHLSSLFAKTRPTVLGLSVYSGSMAASLFAFKLAKETYPHIKTVMGGGIFFSDLAVGSPNFDFFLEKAGYIDKIIIGEGETLLLKFLKGELDKNQKVFISQEKPEYLLDPSAADIPDFSDFDTRYYPHLSYYTSRSCPFQCNFCVETTYWGKFRKKNARKIAAEMIELSRKHNNQLFVLCDCLLNPVIKDLVTEFMKKELTVYWDGYLRVDRHTCNRENTLSWRRSGFYRARLGVESGSQRILDLMNKNITIDHIKTSITSIAYAGIKTSTMWVIGYPGETEADFLKTLQLIDELKDNIYEADCNPFWYYLTGQLNSEEWNEKHKSILLYPGSAKEMLIIQTWILDCQPSREETYDRVNRFIKYCRKLGIPNPYSLLDIDKADERWRMLQKNSVPPVSKFRGQYKYINENRTVKKLHMAQNKQDVGDWGF